MNDQLPGGGSRESNSFGCEPISNDATEQRSESEYRDVRSRSLRFDCGIGILDADPCDIGHAREMRIKVIIERLQLNVRKRAFA